MYTQFYNYVQLINVLMLHACLEWGILYSWALIGMLEHILRADKSGC